MKLLLDSHTLLWYVLGDPQLSGTAEKTVLDPGNEVLTSPASYWEIAIKVSIGKYSLNRRFEDFIDLCLNRYRFHVLPIEPRHTRPKWRYYHFHRTTKIPLIDSSLRKRWWSRF